MVAAPPQVPGLDAVVGLPELLVGLGPRTQQRALKWAQEEDAASVRIIVEARQGDAFLAALGLKAGGCNEIVLRQRLAAIAAM